MTTPLFPPSPDADLLPVTSLGTTAAAGLEPAAAALRLSGPAERRLGDVLIRRGSLTREQLDAALAQHRQIGEPLGAVLLAAGLVTRPQLYLALAEVWGADMAFIDPEDVDPDLARLFPSA